MKKEWINIISQIAEDIDQISKIECPNCEECEIDYTYVGDGDTRIGFLLIWCNKCFKGIRISRAIAPVNAKFVTFKSNLKGIFPIVEFVDG